LSKGHFPGHGETVGQVNVNWAIRILPNLGRQDLWAEWFSASQTGRRTNSMCADVALFRCPSDTPTETYPLTYVVNCGLPNWGPFPREVSGGNDWPPNGLFHLCNTRIEPPWGAALLLSRNWRNTVYVSKSDIRDGLQYTVMLSENLQATEWVRTLGGTPYANIDEYRIGITWLGVPAIPEIPRLGINQEKTTTAPAVQHARPSANHGNIVVVTFCDGSQRPVRESSEYFVYAQLMSPDGQNVIQQQRRADGVGIPAVPKTPEYADWYRPLRESDF
jgi:hypothetical protein